MGRDTATAEQTGSEAYMALCTQPPPLHVDRRTFHTAELVEGYPIAGLLRLHCPRGGHIFHAEVAFHSVHIAVYKSEAGALG
jgi:hypothetical protein